MKRNTDRVHSGVDVTTDRPVFVISDLHIGNGSYLDQFRRAGAEPLLLRFLDYVAEEGGQLMINGDLLELWRFPVGEVVDYRGRLLEKLSEASPIYIPGNHDISLIQTGGKVHHPLLDCIQSPLILPIGERRFRFMHGHELDPLISPRVYSQTIPSYLSPAFALKDAVCRWTGGALSEVFLEGAECVFKLVHGLGGNPSSRMHPELVEERKRSKSSGRSSMRAHRMLSRYRHDTEKNAYDVAVVGHSHKVGRYGGWYFNSGCWIQARHSFLKIWPDGHVEVFDWDGRRPKPNHVVVGAGPVKLN